MLMPRVLLRALLAALGLAALLPAIAAAAPVALNEPSYLALGRVFPDPLAGCQRAGGSPCDPNAQGNVAARTHVGLDEFVDALKYMNTKPAWQRYMEVYVLDGRIGDGSATKAEVDAQPATMFPGNGLPPEFTPDPAYQSAGLPTTTLGRDRNDLVVVRVTDESVPDAGKKRMALSLSIHGIERAGAEGGIRTLEDLVTAATSGRSGERILPAGAHPGAPTFAEALARSIVYFTFPNPDGWQRGSATSGGAAFQRYNGNGIDPNRDYLDIGYNFRGYSGNSEPETRAFKAFYTELRDSGKAFQAADDLHGQPFADALSYTLMPHGSHDLAKDNRIRVAVQNINRAQYEATKWSPIIQDNDQPVGGAPMGGQSGCVGLPALGPGCKTIYAQTWGSVYDTINYTTTGTLGDWFDSEAGLNADGIDNEMSFSHLYPGSAFEPQAEQLHVAGNRAIILSHLADILDPPSASMDPPGAQGYVPNRRIVEAGGTNIEAAPEGTRPQARIDVVGTPDASGQVVIPFSVERTPEIFNGGMRVDVTTVNALGISTGSAALRVQCQHCDDHVGLSDVSNDEWITVAEDYNQSPIYLQAGVTAAVNAPDAYYGPAGAEQKVGWRAIVSLKGLLANHTASPGPVRMTVEFSSGPATDDGDNGPLRTKPPVQAPVDVANTDFFADLNAYIPDPGERFEEVDPAAVVAGTQTLDGLRNLVLADTVVGASDADKAAWLARVRDWVQAGGNLVLTDGAVTEVGAFVPALAGAAKRQTVYVGNVSFCTALSGSSCTANTLGDPLNEGVAPRGSRFNSGLRRQTFEPTPIGCAIQNAAGADASGCRQYDLDRAAFEKVPGARLTATSVNSADRGAQAVTSRVTMGEIKLGKGTIRLAGALLPQPDSRTDHPLGLSPYAVTYTGYILSCNLLDAVCPDDRQRGAAGA